MLILRTLFAGAIALALLGSACVPTAQPGPTSAQAAKPTEAPKPAATVAPAVKPAASPSPAAKPAASPATAPSPAASPATAPSPAAAPGGVKPNVRIGSTNFGEQILLGEMYAQVLESNGYRVERRFNLGNREIVYPALESGQIDLYPEYLATLLAFVTKGAAAGEQDPAAAQRKLQDELKPKGLAVLDYAPAVDTNAFVVTKATAEKFNLKKMSDLAPIGNQLVLGGPPECPDRPFCLPGLENTYGIKFKDFKPLDAGGPLTVAALEGNQVDVGLQFSTSAVISARGFVLLEDDKHLQAADNIAPVVRDQVLTAAPADFKSSINAIAPKLTTAELTDLNKQVEVDRKDPKDVAAAWLKAKGLVK